MVVRVVLHILADRIAITFFSTEIRLKKKTKKKTEKLSGLVSRLLRSERSENTKACIIESVDAQLQHSTHSNAH